jgi:type IV pilus assembly protein PilM
VGLFSIGCRTSLIDILKNGRSAFRGDLSVGGMDLTEALMADANVSYPEAERIKAEASRGGPASAQLAPIFGSATKNLILELKRSLNLYWGFSTEDQISTIYLCGGGALVPELPQMMSESLGVPVHVLDPLNAIRVSPLARQELQPISPLLAVGVGLSFRRPGDR